jgi:outer membrane protein OmpA-like peptidoglycan-associated protein/tetratricopeptide (TPR) repeat protein
MKKYILYCTVASLALLYANVVFAQQNVEFEKKNFPKDREGLKKAIKQLELGRERYSRKGASNKMAALPDLLHANNFNPNNAELNVMIGDCYIRSTGEKEQAIQYLEKAITLSPSMKSTAYWLLGEVYHLTYEFDKAIQHFNLCKNFLNAKSKTYADDLQHIKKRIAECETGKELVKNPVNVFIDNLGKVVNTSYSEYGPLINADASTLYFTSSRPSETESSFEEDAFNSEEDYPEDIYVTHRKDGEWTTPERLHSPINTPDNDAAAGISPSGDILFLFLPENGGDLGYTTLNGATWMPKKSLGNAINSPAHEANASLSSDGQTLYFVSNRSNPNGYHQVYYSNRDAKGAWMPAKPIGAPIASGYDERTVFIHTNGKTLYFTSNGHNTMGGYDIFRSDFENGHWTTPVNMGYPINTPEDDRFFTLNASGRYAYFSSFRKDGFGLHDLYRITFIGDEKPVINVAEDNLIAYTQKPLAETSVAQKQPQADSAATAAPTTTIAKSVTLLKGVVRNAETRKPLFANIEITDNEMNKVIASFTSNSETGSYMVALPSGKNYGLAVKAPGHLFYSENIDVRDNTEYQETYKEIDLNEILVGNKVVLNNIFFQFGKSELSEASTIELKSITTLLNNQPKLRIEISGHTDNIGSAEVNKMLSEARAKAVVAYLVEAGIAANRLTYVGYGFDQPVTSNATAEGRAANRRTEFKVIEN